MGSSGALAVSGHALAAGAGHDHGECFGCVGLAGREGVSPV